MKNMRRLALATLFAAFPAVVAFAGMNSLLIEQPDIGLIIQTGGEIKGKARAVTPRETRTIMKRYRSIPGGGEIKGQARKITPAETRTVLKRYRSIPGGGDIKGQARKITPAETRTVLKRYRSIPGGGDIKGQARKITPAETRTVLKRYRSIPGGFLLEGRATGLPRFKTVRYDAARNAFMLDGRISYASPLPAAAAATLARAIAADDRIGVSLGEDDEIIYGRLPEASDVTVDLKLADNFLGDMILPPQEWTSGYKFANGHQPRQSIHRDTAVFFKFSSFVFAGKEGVIELAHSAFDVRIVPVLKKPASDGSYLPDFKAIETGNVAEDFLANAAHVADNISYYVQEDLIANVHAYAESAAFFRSLKAAKVDLRRLASSMDVAAASTSSPRRFAADTLEGNWLEYLKDIQGRNRYGNWSGPPADLYQGRIKNAAAPAQSGIKTGTGAHRRAAHFIARRPAHPLTSRGVRRPLVGAPLFFHCDCRQTVRKYLQRGRAGANL